MSAISYLAIHRELNASDGMILEYSVHGDAAAEWPFELLLHRHFQEQYPSRSDFTRKFLQARDLLRKKPALVPASFRKEQEELLKSCPIVYFFLGIAYLIGEGKV